MRVVVLGVRRHTVFWAEKHGCFVGALAHQAGSTVRLWSEMHTAFRQCTPVWLCDGAREEVRVGRDARQLANWAGG